ncbi:MAG: flagellar hook-associated protein FlgL [Ignavibacteriales bacterium]|nr:flagellar hook-associated protein FlgL [Ignavibacteriales bacterium]
MRIPDSLLINNFMYNLNKSKNNLSLIQTQLTTQSKVNKPSDNPLSNNKILRLQNQLTSIYTYKENVSFAQSILEDSISSMDSMSAEILNVQQQLTQLNSAIVGDDLNTFAQSIDASLEILLELSNNEFNGQYSFGGSESNKQPFIYDKVNNIVTTNNNVGGDRLVRISPNIIQKINIHGKELFQSVFTQSGNLDSTVAVGGVQTNSTSIYDAEGNEYTLNMAYTKTAANEYEMNYTIVDSDSNIIEDQTVTGLAFNSETGAFESMNGDSLGEIHVKNADNKIDFIIDLKTFKEKDSATNFVNKLNQKADIFNTLIAIRDKLLNGEKPTGDQVEIVNDFYQHLLNNQSKAGGILKKLQSTEEILQNQELEVSELLSYEKDVDVTQALIDLESAQYTLDVSYKISSMLLPKSILDYM